MHYTLWMLSASFMFAAMGATAKLASATYTSAEMVFYRGLISLVLIYFLAKQQHIPLKTKVFKMHVWRSFIGCMALLCNFYAITYLPLATAMTLSYMSSLWVGVFVLVSAIWLNYKKHNTFFNLPLGYILVLLFSFIGVAILLKPTISSNQLLAGLIGLAAGVMAALAYMQVASLARIGEPTTRTVFYFSLGCIFFGAIAILTSQTINWDWQAAIWLVPIGLFASLGQICLTKAYSLAETSKDILTVANLQYMGIVFSAIFGYLIFQDYIDWLGWLGMSIIITSGLFSSYLRQRRH